MSDRVHYRREQRQGHLNEGLCGVASKKPTDPVPPTTESKASVTCWRCVMLLLGRPIPASPDTPEHDRLKAAKGGGRDATQLIGEFVHEFLPSEGIRLCRYGGEYDELYEVHEGRKLIAKFFGINENALESEKMALLEYQRKMNAAQEWAENEGRDALQRS